MPNHSPDPLIPGRIALAKEIYIDWLSEHRKQVFIGAAVLIFLLCSVFSLSKRFGGSAASDFVEVNALFTAWVQQEHQDAELYKKLQKPIERHPELEAKFGSHIAHRLLSLGQSKEGLTFARAALKRIHGLVHPYYAQFSGVTLFIAQGKLKEALQATEQLKVQMEKDERLWDKKDELMASGTILYAYNLLRLASLEREAGSREGEMRAWKELMENAGWAGKQPSNPKTFDPKSYQALAQTIQQGDVTLLEFIKHRQSSP